MLRFSGIFVLNCGQKCANRGCFLPEKVLRAA